MENGLQVAGTATKQELLPVTELVPTTELIPAQARCSSCGPATEERSSSQIGWRDLADRETSGTSVVWPVFVYRR